MAVVAFVACVYGLATGFRMRYLPDSLTVLPCAPCHFFETVMCTPEEQIRGLDAYADGSAHDCLFILMTPTSHLSASWTHW
jgi:hypothetical protein